jgi:phosphohistidine phosphatase
VVVAGFFNQERMKRLLFMRHGKSSWSNGTLADHDRPLKTRGVEDAHRMGNWLKDKKDWYPESIHTSSAKRALETANIVRGYLPENLEFSIDSALYTFSIFQLLEEIKRLDDKTSSVLLFGHNPAYTALHNYLSTKEVDNVPTAGLSFFQLDIKTWNDLDAEHVIAGQLVTPKMLR